MSQWIRRRRLERCRRDLADPARWEQPVRAIAGRYGFLDPANFTGAFRVAYGITPGEYRRRILRAAEKADRAVRPPGV